MIETVGSVVLWLIAIEILSLAVLPLALRVFFALPDGGYASAKMLGLIVVGYIAWLTGILGFAAFTGPTLVVFTAVIGIVSWVLWGSELRSSWSSTRPLAFGAEATFVVVFLLATVVRSFNAPIAGQEKQMDMTFLNSLIQTSSLPAPDLWLAGFGMPYYYFGYLLQSLLGKVLPIDPSIAYNLAVSTVLALAATGAFGLAASLIKLAGGETRVAIGLGAFGAFALTIMGNLEAMFELIASWGIGDSGFWSAIAIKGLQANNGPFPPAEGNWWFRAARVIPNIQPDGINEFPWFSFILGDLHPHYMAIPLAILICTLACHELIGGRALRGDPLRLAIVAVVLGAVVPSNTWDVPIFWGVFALALLASALRTETPMAAVIDRAKDFGAAVLLGLVCYLPYFVGYVSQPLGLGVVSERTMFGSLFVLFGPLLILTLAGGAVGLFARSGSAPAGRPALERIALGTGALGLILSAMGEATLGFLVATLVFWAALTWLRVREGGTTAEIATGILVIAGLGSILIPEVVYLRDLFGTRMNTVFKFYYDAWILLAIVAPLLAWELIEAIRPALATQRPFVAPVAAASIALAAFFVLGGTIYPVAATLTKSNAFYGGPTLDGMVHLRRFRIDDAAAIDWLKRVRPNAGVVEAAGDDYSDAGRFSTFGGVPTLVGWGGHEIQWRGTVPSVEARRTLAKRVYTESDVSSFRSDLEAARMRYIVVGGLERDVYGPGAGAALEQAFPVAQQFGSTKIYEVAERGG